MSRAAAVVVGLVLWLGAGEVPSHGQGVGPFLLEGPASEHLLEEGRNALLDFRIGAAERTFYRLAERPGGEVAAYYHLATGSVLQAILTEDEAHFERFFAQSDTLRGLLEAAAPSHWRTYLLAESDLQRALAFAVTDHPIRAALAARSAYKGFERLERTTNGFYEPYQGLGLLHVGIGALPSSYRRFLSFFGYKGDIREGLAELRLAAERSRYSREAAATILALADSHLYHQPGRALEAIEDLARSHPESPLFGHLRGYLLLKNRRAAEAEAAFRQVIERRREGEDGFVSYALYYLAKALFAQGRYEEAAHFYGRYYAEHGGPSMKAPAALGAGLSLEMQGDRKRAEDWYRRVAAARQVDTDQAAVREAEARLAQPIDAQERQLLEGRNAYDAGRYRRAEAILKPVLEAEAAAAAARAEAAYRLGRTYQAQEQWSAAEQAYRAGIALSVEDEAMWVPWGLFHLGEIYAERGAAEQAAQAFQAALEYPGDYDFRDALHLSAEVALESIREGRPEGSGSERGRGGR